MTFGDLRIDNPWWLLLVLLLPLLAWARHRWLPASPAFMFSSVQLMRGIMGLTKPKSRALLAFLRWTALLLLVLAMARPQWGEGTEKIRASGIDIAVAFDLSGSMLAEDFQLKGQRANRAAVAKKALKGFVDDRPADRIGTLFCFFVTALLVFLADILG